MCERDTSDGPIDIVRELTWGSPSLRPVEIDFYLPVNPVTLPKLIFMGGVNAVSPALRMLAGLIREPSRHHQAFGFARIGKSLL